MIDLSQLFRRRTFLSGLLILTAVTFTSVRAQRVVAQFPMSRSALEATEMLPQGDSLLMLVPPGGFDYSNEKSRWIDGQGKVTNIRFPADLIASILAVTRKGNRQYYYSGRRDEGVFTLNCLGHEVGDSTVARQGTIALDGYPLAAFRDGGDLLMVMARKEDFHLLVRRIRGNQFIDEQTFPLPFDPAKRKSDYFSFYDANEVRSVDEKPGTMQLVREGNYITLIKDEPLPAQYAEGSRARTLLARINLLDNTINIRTIFSSALGNFMSTMAAGLLYRFVPETHLVEVFSPDDGANVDNYLFFRKAVVPGYFQSIRENGKMTIEFKEKAEPFNRSVEYILVDALDSGRAVLSFVHIVGRNDGSVATRLAVGTAFRAATMTYGGIPIFIPIPISDGLPAFGVIRTVLYGHGKYSPTGRINTATGKLDMYEVGLGPKMKFKSKRYVKSGTGVYGFFIANKSKTVQVVHAPR